MSGDARKATLMPGGDGDRSGVRIGLNARLLRLEVTHPSSELTHAAQTKGEGQWFLWDQQRKGFHKADPPQDGQDTCLFVRTAESAVQPWQTLLQDYLCVEDFEVEDRHSSGAILFMSVELPGENQSRWLAWCFGGGWQMLEPEAIDPRFGLLAALNALSDPDRAEGSGITATKISPREPHLADATLRVSTPENDNRIGRLDTTSDLLHSVDGNIGGPGFGRITGGRAFGFTETINNLEQLRDLSTRVANLSSLSQYRDQYGWIDRVVPLSDRTEERQVLDAVLAGADDIGSVEAAIMWWDRIGEPGDGRPISHFRFLGQRNRPQRAGLGNPDALKKTLTWPMVRNWALEKDSTTDAHVLRSDLKFFDELDEEIGRTSILNLLSSEVHLGGRTYVLSDGDVYRVETDYVQAVDSELSDWVSDSGILPPYVDGDENSYNEQVAANNANAVMSFDRKLIYLPEETSFEPCDLLTTDGQFIHVKRKGKSSAMSHLWSQASVATRLLRRRPDARQRLKDRADTVGGPALTEIHDVIDRIGSDPSSVTVSLAVIGLRANQGISALPLFSRIAMRNAIQTLQETDVKPEIILVPSSV